MVTGCDVVLKSKRTMQQSQGCALANRKAVPAISTSVVLDELRADSKYHARRLAHDFLRDAAHNEMR